MADHESANGQNLSHWQYVVWSRTEPEPELIRSFASRLQISRHQWYRITASFIAHAQALMFHSEDG